MIFKYKNKLIIGIKIGQKECVQKNLRSFVSIGYNNEITTASWGDDEEREILIAYGTKETRRFYTYYIIAIKDYFFYN